jgi:thiamine-monophosphate kinase
VTVSDLTERELIARVQQKLAPAPSWMVIGIGDDAAVVEPVRNQLDVLTVDAIVEGVHFDRRFTPPEAIGHRALAVNLSDLAAMGATPRLALLSLALPAALECDDFDTMIDGLASLAASHRIHVAGGNLTRSPGPLILDVTAIGSAKRRNVLTRGGARPGDEIYVTGTVGGALAGLQCLQESTVRLKPDTTYDPETVRLKPDTTYASGTHDSDTTHDSETYDSRTYDSRTYVVSGFSRTVIRRYLYPEPRVRAGVLLGRNRAATACMDLSDGLADGIRQIAEASGVGATIDPAAVPIEPAARAWFESHGTDPLLAALGGGDDYELVFTASPRLRGRLRAVARHGDVPLTRIGVCTPERELRLRGEIEGRPYEAPLPPGFSHFR